MELAQSQKNYNTSGGFLGKEGRVMLNIMDPIKGNLYREEIDKLRVRKYRDAKQ